MTFDPTAEHRLDALSTQLAGADRLRVSSLPLAERDDLGAHIGGISDTLSVGLIFLHGFGEVASGGPLAQAVPSEVTQWVRAVPRPQSAGRIAGMMASSVCSVLEDYIAGLCPLKLTAKRLAVLRLADTSLPSSDTQAQDVLAKRVKPSVKSGGTKWIAALTTTFSVTLTQDEIDMLVGMITFRNLYIHDPPKAFAAAISGEELKCWTISSLLLCHRLALA